MLHFSGITTHIPFEKRGKEVFNVDTILQDNETFVSDSKITIYSKI